jgi:uncharacterized protein with PQ loop repeat
MTREQVAKKIHWQLIIWLFGFVNVVAMLPQLWQLIATRKTEGISISMFAIYMAVQIAFSADGYFKRNKTLFVCLGLSAVLSAANIVTIIILRR